MLELQNTFAIDGTAALKPQAAQGRRATAHIIAFPQRAGAITEFNRKGAQAQGRKGARSRIRKVLDSSEMYCSLVHEDFRGCVYGLFTAANARLLACGGIGVAVVSLLCGL